jgi:hypothetical protein
VHNVCRRRRTLVLPVLETLQDQGIDCLAVRLERHAELALESLACQLAGEELEVHGDEHAADLALQGGNLKLGSQRRELSCSLLHGRENGDGGAGTQRKKQHFFFFNPTT